MKITPITLFKTLNTNNFIKKTELKKDNYKNDYNLSLLNYNQSLAFLGISKNLSQTAEKLNGYYPNNLIKNEVEQILKEGNPENKTIYDVHTKIYSGILECYTLEELKERYPEFSEVKSVWDVDAQPKSFVGQFQYYDSEIFPQNEDLTLQLIKLYWGRGFSLSDLSNYIAEKSSDNKGISLYYTMSKKLNIPLMNTKYASILKFSNKEYNKELIDAITAKRKETLEFKKQQNEGEAVYIPRGPLSEAHKQHISQSLKEYYKQNPQAVNSRSKRQQEYYIENPDQAEDFKNAVEYAWNQTKEGKTIKKYLSKFMKKYNININKIDLSENFNDNTKSVLSAFWEKNKWAKTQWSQALEQGWNYVKENPEKSVEFKQEEKTIENIKSFDSFPRILRRKIILWAYNNGYTIDENSVGKVYPYITKEEGELIKDKFNKTNKIIDIFYDNNPQYLSIAANVLEFSIIDFYKDLVSKSPKLPESLLEDNVKLLVLKNSLEKLFEAQKIFNITPSNKIIPIDDIDYSNVVSLYSKIIKILDIFKSYDTIEYLSKKLNHIYSVLYNNGTVISAEGYKKLICLN